MTQRLLTPSELSKVVSVQCKYIMINVVSKMIHSWRSIPCAPSSPHLEADSGQEECLRFFILKQVVLIGERLVFSSSLPGICVSVRTFTAPDNSQVAAGDSPAGSSATPHTVGWGTPVSGFWGFASKLRPCLVLTTKARRSLSRLVPSVSISLLFDLIKPFLQSMKEGPWIIWWGFWKDHHPSKGRREVFFESGGLSGPQRSTSRRCQRDCSYLLDLVLFLPKKLLTLRERP